MRAQLRDELRALLAHEAPGVHECTLQVDGANVDVSIKVRPTAGADLAAMRAAVDAQLRLEPWQADECSSMNARKASAFSSRSSVCRARPSVAIQTAPSGSLVRFHFLCARHAQRFVDRVQLGVSPERMKQARREAEQRRIEGRLQQHAEDHEANLHTGPLGHREYGCRACTALANGGAA